ncbi:hypothetical protein MWK69_25085 [Escherichia coli]|nr:hypothetical protein [Escherichia coli]
MINRLPLEERDFIRVVNGCLLFQIVSVLVLDRRIPAALTAAFRIVSFEMVHDISSFYRIPAVSRYCRHAFV